MPIPFIDHAASQMIKRIVCRAATGLIAGVLVASVSVSASAAPTLTTLYGFTGDANGGYPNGSLIEDAQYNLYGTTRGTFSSNTGGMGTVFKYAKGQLTTLYSFTGSDGSSPVGGLKFGPNGSLYGITEGGGANQFGTIFSLSRSGVLSTLISFDGINGGFPAGRLVEDNSGNLYGITRISIPCSYASQCGSIFKITPKGVLTTLYRFGASGSPTGIYRDSKGTFLAPLSYGGALNICAQGQFVTACGSLEQISQSGVDTTQISFAFTNGAFPTGSPIADLKGDVFGVTGSGGPLGNLGTIYKLNSLGVASTFYTFLIGGPSVYPQDTLSIDTAGNLYGATVGIYASNITNGTIFKLSSDGTTLTILANFAGGTGFAPSGGLLVRPTAIFGTTEFGGSAPGGYGTLFKITGF